MSNLQKLGGGFAGIEYSPTTTPLEAKGFAA